jgi:glycogen phosphorylase
MSVSKKISQNIADALRYSVGVTPENADNHDVLRAVSLALRRELLDRSEQTKAHNKAAVPKKVYYLSMEFLIGQSLINNALNLGLKAGCGAALDGMGYDLNTIAAIEPDAALGNGGLGRLAACFLDSMATLGIAGTGCGIRYDFGLFKQEIVEEQQRERPDHWKADSSPWLVERAAGAHQIPLYGHVDHDHDAKGGYLPMWMGWKTIIGVPYEMPIVGYGGKTVNQLRLYSAGSSESFDMQIFNTGDYVRAVEQKIASETVSKVLYPSDAVDAGRELRLIQEYFLVACSLRDIMREFDAQGHALTNLSKYVAIQMNDTHPALAVAELMRMLVDERALAWDDAWELATATLAFTNHTLMPEALERWPVALVSHVLPRHLQIIYEINRRFLEEVATAWPEDNAVLRTLSIIEEGNVPHVRMAHLAIVGSHSVNGVAALHTQLIKSHLVPEFYKLWPTKFNNKTNGVTPRRWINQANPALGSLLTDVLGESWITDLDKLRGLEAHLHDSAFVQRIATIKANNKNQLTNRIAKEFRVKIDPTSLFDMQSKRMHEYKRQLLNLLHVIHLYLSIVEDGVDLAPRTHFFSGKAAPGYAMAKNIIHLINAVASTIARDPRVAGRLNVVFIPDYKVSTAEWLIPAADVSEQISTAGLEASGTGNMKFAMNGALTIGTWDGANIEMAEEIGLDSIYIFGLRTEEVEYQRRNGYQPRSFYETQPLLRRVIDSITSTRFSRDPETFASIAHVLLNYDTYFLLADFDAYVKMHETVSSDYLQSTLWFKKTIINIARMGKFSSDRTIKEYAANIWDV